MCGIIGYRGKKNVLDVVMSGLTHLEYRGYDSAGIALYADFENQTQSSLVIEKAVGKLAALKAQLVGKNLKGEIGMGHTRWATHGVPNLENAHPHRYGEVTIVHNGIFENHKVIRQKLEANGHVFYSDTDTEVAAHLLDGFLKEKSDPILALSMLCDTIHGAYSLGIMLDSDKERLYFIKNGSPLIVGVNEGEAFFASDQAALLDKASSYYALKDLEIGFIAQDEVKVFDLKGISQTISWSALIAKKETIEKVGYKHFMHKEIFEQPTTIARVSEAHLDNEGINWAGFSIDFDRLLSAEKIHIIGCGSAYYAGLMAKPLLESLVRLPVSVEIASEYRYQETLTDHKTIVIAISQSGETIDTLAAFKKALSCQALGLSVCNVVGSAIPSASSEGLGTLFLNAGPEISVASTKAFIAQVMAMKLFTFALAKKLGRLSKDVELSLYAQVESLKEGIKEVLSREDEIKAIAKSLLNEPRMLYLARGEFLPAALEGALKMKELSYIFAEGYPAGELKHGPIALVEPGTPAIVIFGNDGLKQKTASNLQEVKARGAKILSIAAHGNKEIAEESDFFFELAPCAKMFEPMLATIPLQLLAYHLSDLKGVDVDKPRNLAKSVTVE